MFTLRQRLRYAFDNTLSKGTIALIAWLAIVSLAAIAVLALLVVLTGARPPEAEPISFGEALWGNLMRTLDAGTMGGDQGWGYRALMFLVTLLGIFVLSTLIGVLSSGLENQLDRLRKGRSRVVEVDHSVILGWSEQVFPIISELVEANRSRKHACIVILGDKDKVEMEQELRDRISDFGSTRVVCRSGVPTELGDLHIASIDSARSIVLLAPQKDGVDGSEPDVDVIKALLAITNNPKRREARYHIVAEIRDPKNHSVAQMIGKDEVELVLVGDLIARVTAQTCRQSGLSVVYQELLDFGGDEIYMKEEPALHGKTYGQALFAYGACSVIGVAKHGEQPVVNPPHDTVLHAGDRLIIVAQDDDAIKFGAPPSPPTMNLVTLSDPPPQQPEKTLILGWNWRATRIINELDNYVSANSIVWVVCDGGDVRETLKDQCAGLKRTTLHLKQSDTTDRGVLDDLDIPGFDHVIVLCSDGMDAQRADSKTLITLLHLRDIAQKSGTHIAIVSEMLDMKNRELAAVTNADDFIVSNRLVSLMLAQISENKSLNGVFADLFRSEGSELYLKPASAYVKSGAAMNFSTVVEAAAQRGESALGYKIAAHSLDASKSYGVVVNPEKGTMVTFTAKDKVIVLADS